MMNRIFLILIGAIVTFAACTKDDTTFKKNCEPIDSMAVDSQVVYLQNWLDAQGISATKDDRGFFYIIDSVGNDTKPGVCSLTVVSYKGYTLDGYYVDKGDSVNFYLGDNNLIIGWKAAIPLIGEGGKIRFYLPPSLAYGENGNTPKIGKNEYLIFDVWLHEVRF